MGSAGGGGAGGGPGGGSGGGGAVGCGVATGALGAIAAALAAFITVVAAAFTAIVSFATGFLKAQIIARVIAEVNKKIGEWWDLVQPTVSTAVSQYEKQFNIESSKQAIQAYISGPLANAGTCTGLKSAMSGIQGILGQISSAATSIWGAQFGSAFCFGQVVPTDSLIPPFCCTTNPNFGNFEEAGTSKGGEIAKLNKWISWFNAVKSRINGEISEKQSADLAALQGVRSGATKGCSFVVNAPRLSDVLNKPKIRDCFGFLAGYLSELQSKITEALNKIKTVDYGTVIKDQVDSNGALTAARIVYNTGVSVWNGFVSAMQTLINNLPCGKDVAQNALNQAKNSVSQAAAANGLSVTNYSTNAAIWSAVCSKITGSSNAFPTKVSELVCWIAPFSPAASEMMTAAINAITEMPGRFAAKDQLYNSVLDLMIGACQGLIAAISALQDQCNITFSGGCNRGGETRVNPCNRTTGCSFTLTNPTNYNLNCTCTGGCDDSCTVTACGVARNSCYAGGASVSCSWKKNQSKQVIVYDVFGGLSGGQLTCVCTKAAA